MNRTLSNDNIFLNKLTEIIEANVQNEQFGVEELSRIIGMSRSNIYRKLKAATNRSLSQFIREYRLQKAMEMLCEQEATASEIAYKVGFSSPAYFSNCFHDFYGYPPGEVKKRVSEQHKEQEIQPGIKTVAFKTDKRKTWGLFGKRQALKIALVVATLFLLWLFIFPVKKPSAEVNHPANVPIRKSIAVLPIANFTGNSDYAYIADGMHDALIGELGKINNMVVRSRTSTLRYKDSNLSIRQIAKELGVDEIVEASLLCSTDSICLQVQLIQPYPEERHLWSESYQRNFNNVMLLYKDITETIAAKIEIDLTPGEVTYLKKDRQINPDLYKVYIRGKYYMNKLTPDDFKTGLKYMNDAMAIDPAEPLPYLGLALGYSNASHITSIGPKASSMANAYALKALELDSTLAEAYSVLATNFLYHEWNWKEAEHNLKRSIALNPNISSVHYTYGWFLALSRKKANQAIAEMEKAVEIDPLNPLCRAYLAWTYLFFENYDAAIAAAQRTLDLDPASTTAYYVMGSAYAEEGSFDRAIETHKEGLSISPDYEFGLGVAYARAGQRGNALKIAQKLENENSTWNTWGLADIYATLGDKDKAMYWLEKAYSLRHDFIPWCRTNPYAKPLYNDSRFKKLVNRLDLPD